MLKSFKGIISATLTVVLAFGIFLTVGVTSAKADYLVRGATITNVQNTSSNGDNYAVVASGGSGICTNKVVIFPSTGVLNNSIHERGYQAALTALTQNSSVDIYDYSGSSCSNGGQISISKIVK